MAFGLTVTYHYQVWAFNDYGNSVPEGPVAITTLGAPIEFLGEATTSTRVQLTWVNGSGNNELGFEVQKMIGSAGRWLDYAELGPGRRSFIDDQILENRTYSFRVRAFSDFAYSDYTPVSVIATLAAPLDFEVLASSNPLTIIK